MCTESIDKMRNVASEIQPGDTGIPFLAAKLHRHTRWAAIVLCAGIYLLAASKAFAADSTSAKRVLIVHSFGSSTPPFTTHSTAFETKLTEELGHRVDLDEVSLDMARYAQPDLEEPFAEFLLKRLGKWQPDLVVPIGSPAGRFVAKFRDRLFPQTPIIYTGMDRRTLPPDAFERKATFVGEDFNLAGLVEDILQLAPDTNHIVVILGATPLERYWTTAFRSAFEPFAARVRFTWVNDLSFDQMQDLVSKLPPHSFVLLGLLLRDASGVSHNEDDALQRLHAVSKAPINGIFQNQLGLGIVGGRLYQGELEGQEAARIAIRILEGESISNFPPKIIGTSGSRYDWRELQRWNISEDRLPAGSVVDFRQPSVWKLYRSWIVGGVAIICLQSAMIAALVVQRRYRRRIQAELRRNRDELAHITRTTTMSALGTSIAHELNQPLTAILCNAEAAQNFLSSEPVQMEEVQEILRDIVSDNRRAGEIISRLRAMVKKEELEFSSIDVASVIRETVTMVHSDAVLRNVRVSVDVDSTLPRARGDKIQLQQVVLNLLVNSFEAMKDVPAEEREVVVRSALNGTGMVHIAIKDRGHGLKSDNPEQIFEPFYTTKHNGLGIGLSISRSIVEAHGGRLWAERNSDRGTTFHFTVPVKGQKPSP
jgi:signal transduction histidine kinase